MIPRSLLAGAAYAALASVVVAGGARAASFSRANYGRRSDDSRAVRVDTKTVDGKSLAFTLDSERAIHVYGGTARSRTPLAGDCGTISADSSTEVVHLSWSPRASGPGVGPGRNEYDCGYSGSLGAGAHGVKTLVKYRHGHGPVLDGGGSGGVSAVTAAGPLRDLRLTFVNDDAQSASVTAAPLTGSGTLKVKVYEYGSKAGGGGQAAGQPHQAAGGKRSVLKAASDDPRLAAVPLEAGATYSIIVRRGAGSAEGGLADVVLTVTASDQAVQASTDTAASPPPDQPPADGSGNGG